MNKHAMVSILKIAKMQKGLTYQRIADAVGRKERSVKNWFKPELDMVLNVEILKLLEPVLDIDHLEVMKAGASDENYNVDQKEKNKFVGIAQGGRESSRNKFMHIIYDDAQEFKERYFKKADEVDRLRQENDSLKKTIEQLRKEVDDLKSGKS